MKIIDKIFLLLNCIYLIISGIIIKNIFSTYIQLKVSIPIGSIICLSTLGIVAIFTIIKEKISNKKTVMILNISIFAFLVIIGTYLLVIGCFLPAQHIAQAVQ